MRSIFFLLLLVGLASVGTAYANGEKVVFALLTREWVPFEMVIEGKPKGAGVDLFHALMPDGVDASVELMPAPRAALRLKDQPIVYTRLESPGWVPGNDRFLWSDTVLELKTVLYSPAGRPVEYVDETSLHGLKIACIKNYYYPEVQPLFDSGKAIRYDVNDELIQLRMLKAGRVDVAVFDSLSVEWMIKQAPNLDSRDFHVSGKPLGTAELCFVFNRIKAWEKRLPEINEKIKNAQNDGTIEAILSWYR